MKVVQPIPTDKAKSASTQASSSPSPAPPRTPPPKGKLVDGLSFLCWPIDDPFVALLRNGLVRGARAGRPFLHDRDLRYLLNRGAEALSREPNIVNLSIKSGAPFYVVGDIHGQFFDLLTLLDRVSEDARRLEDPSESVIFFLGDYVDRGLHGLEVMVLLLALKLRATTATTATPTQLPCLPRIVLLRGNHEGPLCNEQYGFGAEVRKKYSPGILTLFHKVFSAMPLAACVRMSGADASVPGAFMVHGGLWRNSGNVSGKKMCSDPKLALAELGAMNRFVVKDTFSGILGDALWGDPGPGTGFRRHPYRSVGVEFGADVLTEFLRANSLGVMLRAHEGPDARSRRDGMPDVNSGYAVDCKWEDGRPALITVFSAPNYPQNKPQRSGETLGAFAKVVFVAGEEQKIQISFESFSSIITTTSSSSK